MTDEEDQGYGQKRPKLVHYGSLADSVKANSSDRSHEQRHITDNENRDDSKMGNIQISTEYILLRKMLTQQLF